MLSTRLFAVIANSPWAARCVRLTPAVVKAMHNRVSAEDRTAFELC